MIKICYEDKINELISDIYRQKKYIKANIKRSKENRKWTKLNINRRDKLRFYDQDECNQELDRLVNKIMAKFSEIECEFENIEYFRDALSDPIRKKKIIRVDKFIYKLKNPDIFINEYVGIKGE